MQACRRKRAPGDSSRSSRLFVSLSLCGLLLLGIQIERVASAPAGEDDAASPVGTTTLPAMLDTTTEAAEAAASTTTTTTTTTEATITTIGVEQSSASTAAESAAKLDSSTTLEPNKLNASEAGELENPKNENYRYDTTSSRRVSKAFQTLKSLLLSLSLYLLSLPSLWLHNQISFFELPINAAPLDIVVVVVGDVVCRRPFSVRSVKHFSIIITLFRLNGAQHSLIFFRLIIDRILFGISYWFPVELLP